MCVLVNRWPKQVWNKNFLKTICAFANTGCRKLPICIDVLKKWHLSKPRNEFIADVFFKAGMIEAWGRGTIHIVDECKKAGMPEPEFREEFSGLSVHFKKEAQSGAQSGRSGEYKGQVTPEVTEHVTEHVKALLTIMVEEKSRPELQKLLGIKHRPHFMESYINPALNGDFIEMTIPDKPRSSKQKYRLTYKGRAILGRVREDERK